MIKFSYAGPLSEAVDKTNKTSLNSAYTRNMLQK